VALGGWICVRLMQTSASGLFGVVAAGLPMA
jgi:hypothetical protein